MKLSSLILLITFTLLVTAMFASNILLKKEYDKIDKTDVYWTYGKVFQQPFKYLNIEGGNITNIVFSKNPDCSVSVLKNWEGYEHKVVSTTVKNDTLFVKFILDVTDPGVKEYLSRTTLVRILAPELLSVEAHNTNLFMYKLAQKSLSVNLSGRSTLEVESNVHEIDNLIIQQKDSSAIAFQMSPEAKPSVPLSSHSIKVEANAGQQVDVKNNQVSVSSNQSLKSNGWETIFINNVDAAISGISRLDLGHTQINSLQLSVADSSSVILSGASINQLKHK